VRPSRLSVLSADELDMIHEASVDILSDPGFVVHEPGAIRLLEQAGAVVTWEDEARAQVRLSRDMVESAIETMPRRFALMAREGEPVKVGEGQHYHFIGAEMTRVLDFDTQNPRPATLDDLIRFTRLGDALPLICGITPEVYPQDVPQHVRPLRTMAAMVTNTTKHCLAAPLTFEEAEIWLEIGEILANGQSLAENPVVSLCAASTPPLQLSAEAAKIMLLAARKKIPLVLMPVAMTGMTAPITLAGAVACYNAQALFLLTLIQCAQPGAPVLLDVGLHVLDMRTADMAEGGPEFGLTTVAGIQLAERYGIPTYAGSAHSDSKLPDLQTGAEKMACWLTGVLAGLDISINAGALSKCSLASYEQMVLDHEMLRYLQRFAAGILVNPETIALDTIRSVGPEGNFMNQEHTIRWLRSGENLYLELFDRTGIKSPVEGLLHRAHAYAEAILAEHEPTVQEHVIEQIDQYAAARERSMQHHH
jgi:trimethylamine--corrinoid protein Co-methyltransferase